MKNKKYQKLNSIKKRARLIARVIEATEGKISQEALESLKGLEVLCEYDILIVTDAEQLAEKATLLDKEEYEYQRGCNVYRDTTSETAQLLHGSVEFGNRRIREYNSPEQGDEDDFEEPDFTVTDEILFAKETIRDIARVNEGREYYVNSEIIVYLPGETPFKVDDCLMELIRQYNITE